MVASGGGGGHYYTLKLWTGREAPIRVRAGQLSANYRPGPEPECGSGGGGASLGVVLLHGLGGRRPHGQRGHGLARVGRVALRLQAAQPQRRYTSVVQSKSNGTFKVTNNMAASASVIINLIPFPATNEVTNQTTAHNNDIVLHVCSIIITE